MKRLICSAASLLGLAMHALGVESSLEEAFRSPPVEARPYVWWHWMGANFSKEGITKDLEAMKASGIGGATIFNLTSAVQESQKPTLNLPWPDQTYRSPKYWDAVRHAAAEADRLGLEIGLHNTVGYSTTGGPWIDEAKNMRKLTFQSITVDGGKSIETEIPRPDPVVYRGWGANGKSSNQFEDIAVIAVPATGDVDPAKVIDLTTSFRDNRLKWAAPAGKWQVFRICHSPTGACPHPLPDELIGKTMEVDKMSLELNRFHWDQVIEPMKQHLGPYLGKSLRHFLIDSYEAGAQNWTAAFRAEFQKRKGYDPLPWLLTLEKRTVGNRDLSARFSWDMTDMVRTLYYENGWLTGVEKIKKVGAKLQFEPYGGPFDTIEGAALADLPMGEFWTGGKGGINGSVVAAARAAGRTVVGAEAFTGPPTLSKWSETPAFLKRSADGTYVSGANRLVLHHWVHQPFDDRYKPGMGMGWWGTHFNRHQTWARDGVAFFQYLGRSQALLQSGEAPADYVSVGKPEGSGDAISWRAFRSGIRAENGEVILPSGRRYRFLSIPHDGRMTPSDVEIIAKLLEQGASIVCTAPRTTPGLVGYPESERTLLAAVGKLWSDEPIRKVGKGRLFSKGDLGVAIRELDITPMIEFKGDSGIIGTSRVTREGPLFFVANSTKSAARFTASFRITGKRPELWNAETGSIAFAPVWREVNGRTEVDLTLAAEHSVFVVFRSSRLPADHAVAVEISTPPGSGLEILKARFGAAPNNRWMDVTEVLQKSAASGGIHIQSVSPAFFHKDPAPNTIKQLEIEYRLDGKPASLTVEENKPLTLGKVNAFGELELSATEDGTLTATSNGPIQATAIFASGKRQALQSPQPSPPITLDGPWQVILESPVDATRQITLKTLADLSTHKDDSVKYFSGTARYRTQFQAPVGAKFQLDLGNVCNLARVTLNGKDLGVTWQAPFVQDLTGPLKPGANELEIAVTNTWHNRLVGDEQFPADFEWGEDREVKGRAIKSYPDWFLQGKARPENNRKCFVLWYYHRKDTPLLPAGLLGPVRVIPRG